MNANLTEIAYILDRSGSMETMQEPAVAAFNAFVKAQLDVLGEARFALIQWDDAYEVPIAACPIREVRELTAATYTPRGMTALLDAIGRTIKDIDRRRSALPDPEKPGKVILAIFTDREENASREYTLKPISDLIRLYRDEKGWEFLLLAGNQDAIASAGAMGMSAELSADVSFNEQGIKSTGSSMARKVRAMRMKTNGNMGAQAIEDDAKTTNVILKEEEQKDR
jgi:hypothetical protein